MTLNVLFLAAEAEPFVKIGGLGDVAGALPAAIHHSSREHPSELQTDIRLVLPYHYAIKQRGVATTKLGEFPVPKSEGTENCHVYSATHGEITTYFLDGSPINEKSPVYSSDPTFDGYKFVFFSLASLYLADFLNWRVDILHSNDWHTAAAIYALKTQGILTNSLIKSKTVHTLHNLPYMGSGTQQALTDYGLPPTTSELLPAWARHVPLPLGLLHADRIIAVSPHYAEEVLTPEFGCGLEGFLKSRNDVLLGILNGLDTKAWDPQKDPAISQNYTIETLHLRGVNKSDLQKRFNLEINRDIPLLTLISRMDPQKGIDIALKGLKYCEDQPWQAIILGTGDPSVEEMLRQLESHFPDRVRAVIDFDGPLARQLYAGADIFMMPSRYEPCGLSQMIAMRYGCVPIARATGGLVDTIDHVSHAINGGTGFLFDRPYPSDFARVLKRAIRLFAQPEHWQKIQQNGMKRDFTWKTSAYRYIDVYRGLISR